METEVCAAERTLSESANGHLPLASRIRLLRTLREPVAVNRVFFECAKRDFNWGGSAWECRGSAWRLLHVSGLVLDAADESHRAGALQELGILLRERSDAIESDAQLHPDRRGLSALALARSVITDAVDVLDGGRLQAGDDTDQVDGRWMPDFCAAISLTDGIPSAPFQAARCAVLDGREHWAHVLHAERLRDYWRWFLQVVRGQGADAEILPSRLAYPLGEVAPVQHADAHRSAIDVGTPR